MSITDTTARDDQATDPIPEQQRQRPTRRTGVLIGAPIALLGAVAATALALGTGGADRPADAPTPVVSNPPAAYQPGGSVYDAQVPQPGPRILVP